MNDNGLSITMLGTGHATVTKCYNTCFILRERERCFLVDGGGGNQILRILEEQDIALTQIHDLFITHAHSDHILGAVWIVRRIGQLMLAGKYGGELRIYACDEVMENLQTICGIVLMKKVTDLFGGRMRLVRLRDGDSHIILGSEITFFNIMSTKLIQYGFKMTEESLFFCGDEPLNPKFYAEVKGASWLLHEAFCLYAEKEKLKAPQHCPGRLPDRGGIAGEKSDSHAHGGQPYTGQEAALQRGGRKGLFRKTVGSRRRGEYFC